VVRLHHKAVTDHKSLLWVGASGYKVKSSPVGLFSKGKASAGLEALAAKGRLLGFQAHSIASERASELSDVVVDDKIPNLPL